MKIVLQANNIDAKYRNKQIYLRQVSLPPCSSGTGVLQPAVEILLNTALIAELIKNGEFSQIKEAMEQSLYPGSQTFEQSLCRLYTTGPLSFIVKGRP